MFSQRHIIRSVYVKNGPFQRLKIYLFTVRQNVKYNCPTCKHSFILVKKKKKKDNAETAKFEIKYNIK